MNDNKKSFEIFVESMNDRLRFAKTGSMNVSKEVTSHRSPRKKCQNYYLSIIIIRTCFQKRRKAVHVEPLNTIAHLLVLFLLSFPLHIIDHHFAMNPATRKKHRLPQINCENLIIDNTRSNVNCKCLMFILPSWSIAECIPWAIVGIFSLFLFPFIPATKSVSIMGLFFVWLLLTQHHFDPIGFISRWSVWCCLLNDFTANFYCTCV